MHRIITSGLAVCAAAMLLTPGTASATSTSASSPVQFPSVQFPSSWHEPTPIRDKPTWLPENLGEDSTVILVPGTSDFRSISSTAIGGAGSPMGGDQYGRTVDVGFYDAPHGGGSYNPKIVVVQYPAAFGIVVGGKEFDLSGTGTYNHSVDIGTANGLADAEKAWADRGKSGAIVLNGYSQSGPVALNIAYLLHQKYAAGDPGAIPDANIVVVVGADSRFPNSGIETVIPSFIPGAYTNGARDESDTGDIQVISYCVRGDSVCGLGNPLAHPLTSAFYFLPGATIHGQKGNLVNQYQVVSTREVGNTTYVVLDGGNPYGIFLRSLGIPVPPEFDDVLDALVPVPEPGEASTVAGVKVPTPREIQVALYDALGLQVPVTDPDALAAQGKTWHAPEITSSSTASESTVSASTRKATATTTATPTPTESGETFGDYLADRAAATDKTTRPATTTGPATTTELTPSTTAPSTSADPAPTPAPTHTGKTTTPTDKAAETHTASDTAPTVVPEAPAVDQATRTPRPLSSRVK